ncbi:TPA: hypothetical protein ACQYE6_004559 [Vibrio parahaemolyticus]
MSGSYRVYPHNDLVNLGFYHLKTVRAKVENDVQDAIALDCHSCLIALAFSVEAFVNFVGDKKVTGWEERQGFYKKMKQICEVASIEFDEAVEPFSTLSRIKVLRDSMAHGKPIAGEAKSGTLAREALKCPWDDYLTPEFAEQAYAQVKEFQKLILDKSGIRLGECITMSCGWE